MFALLIVGEYSVFELCAYELCAYKLLITEAFYNAFPAPWLDKHVNSLAQIIV